MKQAEVAAYFRRFEEAERKYLDMDRRYKMYLNHTHNAGIIFGGDSERFAHFSAKNLIEFGMMGEKSHSKM